MEGVKYFVHVAKREDTQEFIEFYKNLGVNMLTRTFCGGSVKVMALDVLGIENTEKVMFSGMVTDNVFGKIRSAFASDLKLFASGNGIFFAVPVDGIGGSYSKNHLLGEEEIVGKEKKMEEKSNFVLITVIADKGNLDLVMDAAREAGATGGTVVSAKGTGTNIAKFFGVAISEEKEMIYIVSKRETRDRIMKEIIKKAGGNTDAHAVVFSLPVEYVLGLKGLEQLS